MNQINVLQNGQFAEGFFLFRNEEQLETALGWAPWWQDARPGAPRWQNQKPTFLPTTVDGELVQELRTPYGTHTGGLWQQVPAAPGNRYELTVDGQAWSSEEDTPHKSRGGSDVNLRIGVDPTGGLDPTSPLIEWSEPVQALDRWVTLRLTARAEANVITIYLASAPNLPKRNQSVYWRNAVLLPVGRFRRSRTIVGPGDTHINLEPEHPNPDEPVSVIVSSTQNIPFVELFVYRPDNQKSLVVFEGISKEDGRHTWRYQFTAGEAGLYDLRFVADKGARLLAQRLIRVSKQTQIVPSGEPRTAYRRVYVLLPPTANRHWAEAAVRGSFEGRYTVGFSADDAGVGDLDERHVIAVNPHHWPGVLTASWFQQNYPGVNFIPVVANTVEDLEAWLKTWILEENGQKNGRV